MGGGFSAVFVEGDDCCTSTGEEGHCLFKGGDFTHFCTLVVHAKADLHEVKGRAERLVTPDEVDLFAAGELEHGNFPAPPRLPAAT